MKFGLMFANAGPFGLPDRALGLAQAAEACGFESLWTVEHVVVPAGYQSRYPYAGSGRMPGPDDMPLPDPLIWLSFVAAVTKTIRLATGIVILPQRHPFYLAKELATLDQLSGGRTVLGVGIGWLREEFDALGIPFEERASRAEEACAALRTLWRPGGAQPFAGKHFQWGPVHSNPKPVQPGGVPIVVGGHAKGAARRAARVGDGWFPVGVDLETLAAGQAELRAECARVGRDPGTIEITTGFPVTDLDTVKRARDLGVARLVVAPPGFDPDGLRRGLERFANEVIAKA
jgi:probable F420-dependent oxidoreductase